MKESQAPVSSCPTRCKDLDAAHGLLILYMMFMHTLGFAIGTGSQYYYPLTHPFAFFMAWFYYKSGMLYKEKGVLCCVRKGLIKLLLPAVAFMMSGFIIYCGLNHFQINLINELKGGLYAGALNGNNPIWFLFSLFFVQTIYSLLRDCHISRCFIFILSIVGVCISRIVESPVSLFYNVPLGFFFYCIGNLIKEKQYEKPVWIPSVVLFIALFFVHTESDFRIGYYNPYFVTLLWSLAGCITVNVLFKRIKCLCIAPLSFVGTNAIYFYGTHWMILLLIQKLVASLSLDRPSSISCYVLLLSIYVILLYIILLRVRKKTNN